MTASISTQFRRILASGVLAAALVAGAMVAKPAHADTGTFTQSGNINFPDLGYASPLPSQLLVGNLRGTVSKVTMHLENFSSANPNDVDLLLVSPPPQRRTLVPISDAGGLSDIANLEFDFDDAAAGLPSQSGPLVPGTYRPSDFGEVNELMGMGAPNPPYGTSFATFNGLTPNGTWQLYGFADFFNGSGTSSIGDWSLTVTTVLPTLTLETKKKQRLKKKLVFFATSNVPATLTVGGGVKPKTIQLAANTRTKIRGKVRKKIRKRLAKRLAAGRKAKVKLNGVLTDTSGTASDPAKAKAKLKP